MTRRLLLVLGILLILWGIAQSRLSRTPVPVGALDAPVTRIEIDKSERRMTAYAGERAMKTYRIALGFAPEGDKVQQGDGKTPEGRFVINRRNGQSKYHLSLGLDYPQPDDVARARSASMDPGGDIFIHGQPNELPDGVMLDGDWTAGCIAVTDAEIRELWDHVAMGTEVVVTP